MWMWMECVPAVVKVIVAAAVVEAVAVRRLWRGCLNPVTIQNGQGDQCKGAGSEKQHQVRAHLATAPP